MTAPITIDLDDLIDFAEDLHDAGADEDKAIAAAVDLLDGAVDWREVFPGAAGELVEKADGPAIEAIAKAIKKAIHGDPRKKAIRKKNRRAMRVALKGVTGRKNRTAIRRTFRAKRHEAFAALEAM